MLKGVIKALDLQDKCMIINLVGHGCLSFSLQYYFGIKLGYGLFGLWASKFILEIYVYSAYYLLVRLSSWEKAVERAKVMQNGGSPKKVSSSYRVNESLQGSIQS